MVLCYLHFAKLKLKWRKFSSRYTDMVLATKLWNNKTDFNR